MSSAPLSPENVRLDRVSDNIVRLSWTAPEEDSACQTYFFITGTQNGQSIHHRVPGTERSIDLNGPAQGDWRVEVRNYEIFSSISFCLQVRTVNSAGSGPSSRQAVFTSAQQCKSYLGNRNMQKNIILNFQKII